MEKQHHSLRITSKHLPPGQFHPNQRSLTGRSAKRKRARFGGYSVPPRFRTTSKSYGLSCEWKAKPKQEDGLHRSGLRGRRLCPLGLPGLPGHRIISYEAYKASNFCVIDMLLSL